MNEFIGRAILPFFFSTSFRRCSADRVTWTSMSRTGIRISFINSLNGRGTWMSSALPLFAGFRLRILAALRTRVLLTRPGAGGETLRFRGPRGICGVRSCAYNRLISIGMIRS
ncbi:hypothetical protein ACKS0A_11820 [Histoplasma ohiense]